MKPISSQLRQAIMMATVLIFLLFQVAARAGTIAPGNVTTALGPAFFVDDAATGGGDVIVTQPTVASYNRSFAGLLNTNQGQTRVTFTGFGFATANVPADNTATSLTVSLTYLGADEATGGGDDVLIGSATAIYSFVNNAEYVFSFDAPLTAALNVTGVRFLLQVTPSNTTGNGKVRFKTAALTYETGTGPKFSVSGNATQRRLNLAKYQSVTADSVSGQQLATYLTDGVVGNDNRWQSTGNAPHWARVDFPFPVQVGSSQVFSGLNDGNAMTSFKLQYLNNSTWVDVPGTTVTGNTSVDRNLIFTTPVTASAFRLYDSVDGTIRVKELALYPPNGGTTYPTGTDLTLDLANHRPALATANTTGNFALLAVDGRVNKDSMWQTSLVGSNELEIDLRVSTKVGSAHLYSGSPGVAPISDFVLRYWDGSAWQDIPGTSVTGNTSPALVISFTSSVITSQVKLVFNNAGTSSVQELCVLPANNNGGYPIGTGVIGAAASTAKYDDYNDAYYNITNPASGLFIADSNGSPGLSQPASTTAQGQYQVLLNISTGTYRLRNRATGLCLSGAQLSTNAGDLLVDAPYSALPDQDWILQPSGGTNFNLVNQWSGLVIDTQGGGMVAGTPLVQNIKSGSASQLWQFDYSTHFPKKGVGGTTFANTFKVNWAYNWAQKSTQSLPAGAIYNPMQWGNFNWSIGSSQGPNWQYYSAWRTTSGSLHQMGFNEPDKTDQANMTVADGVTLWPRLQAMDAPLVGPCPANMTGGWLASFYTQADNLGYRVDYTPKHSYGSPQGGSSDNLISGLLTGYNTWGRPMWLTEFGFVDYSSSGGWNQEDNYNCLAEFLWRAESISWLRKYALFVFTEETGALEPPQPWSAVTPAPRSNSYDINGNLTPFGELYAAWDRDTSIRPNKTYLVHNKEARKRLSNTLEPQWPNASSIRVDGVSVEWQLIPAPTSGQYYLVSSRDGRRISFINGGSVSLVAAGTTGGAVQWGLTESQYGWFYLEHSATAKRLKLQYVNSTGAATFSMVAITTTGDSSLWRFIVPLPPPSWTGAINNSWSMASNWTSSSVPTTGDTVSFDSSSTANLTTALNQDFSLGGLIVTNPSGPASITGTNSLTLGNGGIDMSGATHNLTITAPVIADAAQAWNVAIGRTLGINGGVSGGSPVTITGAGIVSLGGVGTWSGDTTVAIAGTLRVAAANVLPNGMAAGNLILDGTLDLNSLPQAINGLSGSGIVDNLSGGAGVLTIGRNDNVVTLNGTLQNTGGTLALVKAGAGVLTLNTANSFIGGFTNNGAGDIYPKNDASFGTGPVTMNASTLYATGGVYTFANHLTLNGTTLRVGGGAGKSVTWTGPVTATGTSGISADGSTSGITLANTLDITGAIFTSFANGTTNIISGAITGAGGGLAVTSGTLNLEGTCNYSANSTLTNSAVLRLQPTGTITGNVIINGAGNFNVRNTVGWIYSGTISGDNSGQINLNTGTDATLAGSISGLLAINVNSAGTDTTISGNISGATNVVVQNSGAPILRLSGSNSYSGSTTLNNTGTLVLAADNALSGSSAMSIANATLDGGTFTNSTGTLAVTNTAKINLGAGATVAFANSSAVDWTGASLEIKGTFVSGSSLRFGTDANGLTSTQLALISSTGAGPFALNASGYLITPGYPSWAAINAPTGTVSDDFDGDGVINALEYVLGGDKSSNDLAKLPQAVTTGGDLIFSFLRDQSSIDGTTTVVIEVGIDLANWPDRYPIPDEAITYDPGVTVIKNSPSGFDTVTLTLPQAAEASRYLRLKVVP